MNCQFLFAKPSATGDGPAPRARAHELAYVVALELLEQSFGLLAVAGFLYDGVLAVYLQNAGIVLAKYHLEILLVEQTVGRHLIQRHFLIHDLVVRIQERAEHIDTLLYLHDDLLH